MIRTFEHFGWIIDGLNNHLFGQIIINKHVCWLFEVWIEIFNFILQKSNLSILKTGLLLLFIQIHTIHFLINRRLATPNFDELELTDSII